MTGEDLDSKLSTLDSPPVTDHQSLVTHSVAVRPRQRIDVAAAAWRVIPHLKADIKIKDERRGNSSARSVNRKHRLPAHLEEVDVLHHGAAPVREIEEVDARLIGVDRGLDRNAGHRFLAGEKH